MAEISKISGVAIADVAKVDAILKADIANINGLTVPSAAAFLLDTYTGATAAYSVRRLNSLYTGACMRVRRDSDNTEQDIGFDGSGNLDTAAIATFVGSGNNGYIRYWYDQSQSGGTGSGNDAFQATAAGQPQIYNGTSVITENGKPAVKFDGSTSYLPVPTAVWDKDDFSAFVVAQATNADAAILHFSPDASDWAVFCMGTASTSGKAGGTLYTNSTLRDKDTGDYTLGTQALFSGLSDVSTLVLEQYLDGTAVTGNDTVTAAVNEMVLGSRRDHTAEKELNGTIQEVVFFGDYKNSTDQGGIETDINTHFSIF